MHWIDSSLNKNENAMELQNISIAFSGVQVLYNACFTLKRNEIHAIVGKNGAGKSTFMKVLTGVYTPNEGKVFIAGEQEDNHHGDKRKQKKVAMVYQDLSLVPSLSVLQNIFLSFHPYKTWGFLNDKKAKAHVEQILEQIGIPHILPNQLVEELSVGEAQLVEIAKAISSQPEIIVFDEPTASLSDVETTILFQTIERLRNQGISIVYITHYLEDVLKICDRVTVLRNGRVISTNKTASSSIETIVSDMLGAEGRTDKIQRRKNEVDADKQAPVLELQEATTSRVGPITMTAKSGEIIGIAGLLGSGRTEILRMLYGLDVLQTGSILINEKQVKIKTPKQAKKYGITLVPEERRTQGLILDFDIEENIALLNLQSILFRGLIDSHKRTDMADKMIKKLQIKATGTQQIVRFLSGGNQQKVVIAKCLASTPKILLLDDPTFGVDVHAKTEIMKIIKDFAEKGNVVIFVSSEFSEITSFCDRTYIVKKKRVINELKNTLMEEEALLKEVQ